MFSRRGDDLDDDLDALCSAAIRSFSDRPTFSTIDSTLHSRRAQWARRSMGARRAMKGTKTGNSLCQGIRARRGTETSAGSVVSRLPPAPPGAPSWRRRRLSPACGRTCSGCWRCFRMAGRWWGRAYISRVPQQPRREIVNAHSGSLRRLYGSQSGFPTQFLFQRFDLFECCVEFFAQLCVFLFQSTHPSSARLVLADYLKDFYNRATLCQIMGEVH